MKVLWQYAKDAVGNIAWAFEKGVTKVAPVIGAVLAIVAVSLFLLLAFVGLQALSTGYWNISW